MAQKKFFYCRIKNGFTLIEILVTITILVILSAISMISYVRIMANSRDTRRKSDMKMIQKAFEQYYAEHSNKYPTDVSELNPYFNGTVPSDPKECSYTTVSLSTSAYQVCADLEGSDGTSCAASNDYCITQLQR